jgi:sugar lactone lactonase YvrE
MHYPKPLVVFAAFLALFSNACFLKSDEDLLVGGQPARHHRPPPQVYVADAGNNRIVRLDDARGDGPVSYSLPSSGRPGAIARDSQGRIYVTDSANSAVIRIDDMTGTNETALGTAGAGTGQFANPQGLAIDADNRIYVADTANNRVVRMDDMSGTNWVSYSGTLSGPTGLALDPDGRIYVVDTGNSRVLRMDDMTGTNLAAFGTSGSGSNQFSSPTGIALHLSPDDAAATDSDPQPGQTFHVDRIAIADAGNSRVVAFDDLVGTDWAVIGSSGAGTDQFASPSGVAFRGRGSLLVSDTGNNRLTWFQDMTGTGWTVVGSAGSAANEFQAPGLLTNGR